MPPEDEADELALWEDGTDEEDDVEVATVSEAVVTDTDWTVETLLNQMWRGKIRLNPRFQRRDAWNTLRKSRYIESLILGLPIPQIVLAEEKGRRGSFIVIDGKQRLLTLLQFGEGSEGSARSTLEGMRKFKLRGLDVRDDLNGFDLAGLERMAGDQDLDSLLNQTIRTVVVRNWPNEAFLNLVFLRLNTGSVSLSPQELRQALHPGPFTDFIDEFAFQSDPIKQVLRVREPDFRMRDVELVLRYFAFREFLPEYRGNLRSFMDATTKKLNRDWSDRGDELRRKAEDLNAAISSTYSVFGRHAFRRWNPLNEAYEQRFNRAVFDCMIFYSVDREVRDGLIEHSESVPAAFEGLCRTDDYFSESLQFTTKSVGATLYRVSTWGRTLQRVLDVDLSGAIPVEA